MRYQGQISEWRDEQGYGFVTPNGGGERVFLHIKALKPGIRRPAGGERVNFVLVRDEKGRPRAEQAEYAVTRREVRPGTRIRTPLLLAAVLFVNAVGALVLTGKLPAIVFFAYLVLSALTLGIYALDKSLARQAQRRVAENTLHLLALLGGWPGALLAQQLLRHKSRKASFQFGFWLTVIGNLAAFGMLLSGAGASIRASLAGG